ncbi:MAG: mandelate racemase/muconate lactonizing enzyme family protein, partial [Massilia sp.]
MTMTTPAMEATGVTVAYGATTVLRDLNLRVARGEIYALLGGKMNDRIRSYTYLYPEPGKESADFWVDPDAAAEAALRFVSMGFTAVKFDPAGPYTIRGGHE